MSNLEHGVPIKPGSIFHVASISKQFTDMCIALLGSEGVLSLDDDIRRYVPEIPDYGETITIRHLIHHTSGLRDMWSLLRLAGWRDDDLINEADMLWVASRQAAPNFRPGDEYLYSNTGYALLALIIHRVSGKTLREFAHDRIFEPLGMTSTHVHDDHTEIVKGRTQAYEPRRGGGLRISIPVFDVAGTTSLFTTVEDMARWDDNFHHHKVGGAAIIDQMLTPGRLNGGGPMTYGFGLNIHSYRGLTIVEHSGADAGYRAHFLRFPDQRLAVVCLCNLSTMTPRTLALAVADIALADQFPEPIYDETLESSEPDERLAGVYRNDDTGDLLRVTRDDEGLAIGFGHSLRLERLRGGTYRIEGQRLTRLRFGERDGRQALVYGSLYSPQPDPVFVRVAKPGLDEPRPFDGGEFHSNEVDASYRLDPEGQALRMTHYRLDEKMLQHAYDDVYASDDLRIALDRDAQGTVIGFRASTGRVRDVWFERC
jgi:CubicO group peptidase (beta-lactamase class C family)